MSPEILSFFASYIERETGILYGENNIYQLKARLDDFCKKNQIPDVVQLYEMFSTGRAGTLKQKLMDLSTNNETSFFRDPVYFKAIEKFVMDSVSKRHPSEITVWSAAASTGQEAISVAITLDELSQRYPIPPFKIMASDISHEVLMKCKQGVYSDFELARGMSSERRDKYFTKTDAGWKVKPQILSRISHVPNNLLSSMVQGPFDVILCRNILIYQKTEAKKVILNSLMRQLHPEGCILLGVGETLLGISEDFVTTMNEGVILYKKNLLKKTA